MRVLFALLIMIAIAVALLIIFIPHHRAISNVPVQKIASGTQNITTSIYANTTTIITTTISTTTQNALASSNQSGFNPLSLINTTSTTALYAYCVGSRTPLQVNQTYYAQLNPINSTFVKPGIGAWKNTTPYPNPILYAGCSIYSGYIYCVGNGAPTYSNETFYAPISSSGIGTWRNTTKYPIPFYEAGCSIYGGYIYCVGDGASNYSQDTFYAPISSSGIGTWRNTTKYPIPFYEAGCSIYSGYIYCVGDLYSNVSGGTINMNSKSYFAPVSSSGIGAWKNTTPYPMPFSGNGCTILGSRIYCVGGSLNEYLILSNSTFYNSSGYKNASAQQIQYKVENISNSNYSGSPVFSASLSSSGIGKWVSEASYPIELSDAGCVPGSDTIYCIGSSSTSDGEEAFYAQMQNNSIIGWSTTQSYPQPFYYDYCATSASSGGYYS